MIWYDLLYVHWETLPFTFSELEMKSFALAASLAFAAALTAAPAFAFPHFNVTNTEIVSTIPIRVKTTFTYEEVGYWPCCYGVDFYVTSSGSGPAVHFYAGESDAHWHPYLPNGDVIVYFKGVTPGGGYNGLHAFSIVTDQMTPCVEIRFPDPILAKSPNPKVESDYVIQACLAVDMPTPTRPATWGTVKAMYR